MTRVVVYLPDGRPGPGRLCEASLDVLEVAPSELVLPEATVRDERGGPLFDDQLVFGPAQGGGPLADRAGDRQARAFGVVNTAFHTQRALRFAAGLLGHPLPGLLVRIGMHDRPHRWGGGHYRLPARSCAELRPNGEVHLGGGRKFLATTGGRPYFHAPAHNAAIINHEVGHHICRHTADFRLNQLRPPQRQTNRKIALDEGTADLMTAILLGNPDIYGWHRHAIPAWDQRRRKLDRRWTMAHFRRGRGRDPHADGTIWASAGWSARQAVVAAGANATRFDAVLLGGLERLGHDGSPARTVPALRARRHFSQLLAAMAGVDPETAPVVLAAMARHGIRMGASNAELRAAAQADLAEAAR